MKFTVKSFVNNVNSSALPDEEATEKEIDVRNPAALLSNLRAKAAVAFRLHVSGFSLVYKGDRTGVSLADERQTLTACGLQDGDTVLLVSKRVREANGCVPASEGSPDGSGVVRAWAGAPHTASAGSSSVEDGALRKTPRVEAPAVTSSPPSSSSSEADDFADASEESEDADDDGGGGDDDDDGASEESAVDIDLGAAASLAQLLGTSGDAAAGELYGRLLEVVPDLVEWRQQFLADPKAVMERIQRDDPTLFQLITAHQEAFLDLINSEDVLRTMQAERDGGLYDDDKELDEEALENLLGILAEGRGDDEDFSGEEGEEGEEGGLVALGMGLGSGAEPTTEHILAFVPSEEDEQKIEQLTQLGFPYDVCKVAFYLSHRSLERAANRLFESPPQL